MKYTSLKAKHSLRFTVISRLFGLIIVSLLLLGGYQYNQIGEQAIQRSESDKLIAESYFTTVLVQAIWEFDEPLIDELVAAQSNIDSLVALSVPNLSPENAPLFIRNTRKIFERSADGEVPNGDISRKALHLRHGEQNIGTIVLYFDDDHYQKRKRAEITKLLLEISVIALALLALFYYFINRYVVTPISNLYQSVERFSHDQKPQLDIQKKLPDNEIKVLAQKYADVYYQLRTHKDHLEELVAVRTTGLEDANEKMKIEIDNRITSEKAMEAAKLEAQTANHSKTRFLSHITHELRTPLNGILGYAQILAERDLPDEEQEYTSHIFRCSSHLLELINNILDYNKIESSQLELNAIPSNIVTLVEEIRTIVYPRCAGKNLALEIELAENLPGTVLVDASKLKQVLINLLANGINFTDKGFVRLTVEYSGGKEFVFSVSDSGQGIPEEDHSSIFKAYQQSKNTSTVDASTGLGLSISKSFVECMGGKLQLESKVGMGSCFFFALSLPNTCIDKPTANQGKIIRLHGSDKLTILIVDDNRDNIFILKKVLQNVGFNVIEARSAKSAFEAIALQTPDLIFMDVQMPEMDGTEAAMIIKKQHSDLPILAFTANLCDETGASMESECFDDYIYKPVNRQAIYQMLIQYLDVSVGYE